MFFESNSIYKLEAVVRNQEGNPEANSASLLPFGRIRLKFKFFSKFVPFKFISAWSQYYPYSGSLFHLDLSLTANNLSCSLFILVTFVYDIYTLNCLSETKVILWSSLQCIQNSRVLAFVERQINISHRLFQHSLIRGIQCVKFSSFYKLCS